MRGRQRLLPAAENLRERTRKNNGKESHLKDNSLYKLGGICSVLVGISYVVIGVTELLLTPELSVENNAQIPLMFFESNRVLLIAQWSAMAWGSVFALAVIPAVSEKVKHLNEGWVRWTSTLATLGFAVTIIDNYVAIVLTPPMFTAYRVGTEATRAAILVPGSAEQIDMRGWLQWGAVGLWVLVVNLLAIRGNLLPRLLAYLGGHRRGHWILSGLRFHRASKS